LVAREKQRQFGFHGKQRAGKEKRKKREKKDGFGN
jgi:hypothetical protein